MQGLDVGSGSQNSHSTQHSNNTNSSMSKAPEQQKEAPKKMTWATIASQPAKPQINTTSTTVKKKGPGMPPPPMVPGKHNMDIGTWDSPSKNAPPMVPPMPPPVIATPPPNLPSQNNSKSNQNSAANQMNSANEPAWPTPGQARNHTSSSAASNQHQPQNNNQQQQPPSSSMHHSGPHHQNHSNQGPYRSSNQNHYQQGGPGHHRSQMERGGYHSNSSGGPPPQHHQNNNHGQYHHHSSSSSGQYHQGPPSHPPPVPAQPQAQQPQQLGPSAPAASTDSHPVLEQLCGKNDYNPSSLDLSLVDKARFFVIKSYSEDDIHRSIKYEIWCSTEHGNNRLDQAYRERENENGVIYLFFSVNGSGHFCGVAQMITAVDYNSNSSVWSQDKWKGSFKVKWIYVKDVPNNQLRHIRLENNENKSVTNSRDAQEVPNSQGIMIMKIIHAYKHTTSIFDNFMHYEKRQEEEDTRKHDGDGYQKAMTLPPSHHSTHNRENMNNRAQYDNNRGYNNDRNDRDYNNGGGYEKSYNGSGGYNKGYNSGNFSMIFKMCSSYCLICKNNHPFLVLKGVTEMSFFVSKRISGNSEEN
jgi:hypothetical protein